jgi:streptomycin 6-kinase
VLEGKARCRSGDLLMKAGRREKYTRIACICLKKHWKDPEKSVLIAVSTYEGG